MVEHELHGTVFQQRLDRARSNAEFAARAQHSQLKQFVPVDVPRFDIFSGRFFAGNRPRSLYFIVKALCWDLSRG
jgi:hypothetical protein